MVSAAVSANLQYAVRPPGGQSIYYYLGGVERPAHVSHYTNFKGEPHQADIVDIRSAPQSFSLKQNGFVLAELPVSAAIDWEDKASVRAHYYPAVQKLLQAKTGARVHVFDTTLRKGSARRESGAEKSQIKPGTQQTSVNINVHVDYSLKSGVERLHQLLPEEAVKLQETPFAILQVWQPIRRQVQDSPLALMDATSLDTKDLVPISLHFPDRTGHIAAVAHNSNHRWYYTSGMRTDECYVWIGYHSCKGGPRFIPHTAFADPTAPPDAPDRESIETRAYVFWENDTPRAPDLDF